MASFKQSYMRRDKLCTLGQIKTKAMTTEKDKQQTERQVFK